MLATQMHRQVALDRCPFSPPQTFDPFAMDASLLTLISDHTPFTMNPNDPFCSYEPLDITIPEIFVHDTTSTEDMTTAYSPTDLSATTSTTPDRSAASGSPCSTMLSKRNSAGDLWPDLSWLGDQTLAGTPSPSPNHKLLKAPDATQGLIVTMLSPSSSKVLSHEDSTTTIYYTPPSPADSFGGRPLLTADSNAVGYVAKSLPRPVLFSAQQADVVTSGHIQDTDDDTNKVYRGSSRASANNPEPSTLRKKPRRHTLRRTSGSSNLRQAFRSSPATSYAQSQAESSQAEPTTTIWTPELERAITIAMLAEMERRRRNRMLKPTPPAIKSEPRYKFAVDLLRGLFQSLSLLLRTDSPLPLTVEPSTSRLAFLRVW